MDKILQINFNFRDPVVRILGADFTSCNGLHILSESAGLEPVFWFQIHRPEDIQKERPEHIEWLEQEHDFPIIMNNPDRQRFPSAVDIGDIFHDLNQLWTWPFPVSYASSFSWQIAVAIYLKYDVIDMQDVMLSDAREKFLEAPNMLLWAGEAHRRGIRVLLSEQYTHQFWYGREERLTNIPTWASKEVVNDMFPGWSSETRELHRDWYFRHYNIMSNAG